MPETVALLITSAIATAEAAGSAVAVFATTGSLTALGALADTAILGSTITLGQVAVTGGLLALGTLNHPSVPSAQAVQIPLKQSAPVRQSGYGKARLAGAWMLYDIASDGTFTGVLAVHDGLIDGFEVFLLNDDKVTVRSDGWVTALDNPDGRYSTYDKVQILAHTGAYVESAFTSVASATLPNWGASYRGDRIAAICIGCRTPLLKYYDNVYPNGIPQPSVIARLMQQVYDPRTGTYGWTQNPVLHLLDYLTNDGGGDPLNAYGMGLSYERYILPKEDLWKQAADDCDDTGSGVPRYQAGGVFSHSTSPSDVIGTLLSTFDGWLGQTAAGALTIHAGVCNAPTVTLGEDEIVGYSVKQGVEDENLVNALTVTFTDPSTDYATADAGQWRDEASIAARGEHNQALDLPWVQSSDQAMRLAARRGNRLSASSSGTVTTNLGGMAALGERYINLQIPEIGLSIPVEINKATIDLASATLSFDWTAADSGTGCFDLITSAPMEGALRPFEPSYWLLNFARPMMAAITTPAENALRVTCAFYTTGDLAGLIWESQDTHNHPILKYETRKSYAGATLSFHWKSSNVRKLDETQGPTLTIQGRKSDGTAHAWYVRLWNYKTSGTNEDADISIPFSALSGGYNLPDDADPVYPNDIDQLFISIIPEAYVEGGTDLLLSRVDATVDITNIAVTGIADLTQAQVPAEAHSFRIATGYDDSYNQTPARLVQNMVALGYRDVINHYVGESHYFELQNIGGYLFAGLANGTLNGPCAAWNADFAARAKAAGYSVIMSQSYELFATYAQDAWVQKDWSGAAAATGYTPPSTLLSPCSADAMAYLQTVGQAFCQILADAGQPVLFQIGEPWWWVPLTTYKPCFFDYATKVAYNTETGLYAPEIEDVRATMSSAQLAYMDWLGTKLGASTLALRDHIKTVFPGALVYLLFYAPQVLRTEEPEMHRANFPVASWAYPAFDVFQLEDYEFVTAGQVTNTMTAVQEVNWALDYPAGKQDYFTGFVDVDTPKSAWSKIDAAGKVAAARGVADVFVWAYPEIVRDGYVHLNHCNC